MKRTLFTLFICFTTGLVLHSQIQEGIPAFPGAEGHGMYTTGGRGGRVIKVTNLNDGGEGSLRAAIEATGPRIVVFEVSGTIALKSKLYIENDHITIAGQTAPGDGICIKNYCVYITASNVIVRYMRFRMGDEAKQVDDAFGGQGSKNMIIDHCSMSWSIDECASFYANENFTMQWCLLTESLRNSHHYGSHGFGGIWGGNKASFHHNLLAHHSNRNPRFRGHKRNSPTDAELVDLRNNVIYNYSGTCYGSEGGGSYNMVNNYYKKGPASKNPDKEMLFVNTATAEYNWLELEGAHGVFYVDGNYISANESYTRDNWNGAVAWEILTSLDRVKSEVEFDRGNIITDDPQTAYQRVLEYAGASLFRDTVDKRAIHDTRTGTVSVMDGGNGSTNGYIDTQEAVGGWPVLNSLPAPSDRDGDGMPDDWELAHGLDPNDPSDGNGDRDHDLYTNIEEYINSLALEYFDTNPLVNVVQPQGDAVYMARADTSIQVEAYSNDYHKGSVVKMELYLDDELIVENAESTKILTVLEDVSPGMHHMMVKSTDDSGKSAIKKTTVFVGRDFQGWDHDKTVKPESVKELDEKSLYSKPIKINFQPQEDYPIPQGYMADFGGKYCDKWNGYTYGWLEEYHPHNGLNASGKGVWETFRNFENEGNQYSWGIELPRGRYRIRLGLGGKLPGTGMTELKINVEGHIVEDLDGVDLLDEHMLENVPVLDGQLSLSSMDQSRICFIEIERIN